jgi:hypothetical protein
MNRITLRNIVLLWLAWVLIVIGFQALAAARLQPQWPDTANPWLKDYTAPGKYQVGRPYLLDPFMNNQVTWDSEPYIGISIGGYDDSCISVAYRSSQDTVVPCTDTTNRGNEQPIRTSYAFFPFYPVMIRLFAIPLSLLKLNPIATATLAGVIVSALGALAAMLALYDLTYEALGEDGGMRAAFYLLIFPTGFFLAQVYTEGLFVGLAFGCLAMLKRKHLVYAALLGAAATLTRAVGVALIIPMAITWIRTGEWMALDMEWGQLQFKRPPLRPVWRALLAFAPLITFLIWRLSYFGIMFDYAETNYFGRVFLDLGYSFWTWGQAFCEMIVGIFNINVPSAWEFFVSPAHSAYYFTEFFGLFVGLIAILRCLKTDPEVAWFSLAVFLISWGSGPAGGIHRYILGAPAVFITLARWGKNPLFDRAWTLVSLLLMGLLAMLFAFNYWVA